MTETIDEVRGVLRSAASRVADPAARTAIDELERRLDEPLRVAIAGKVKAGKSTLLNALVGEELAQTDAGECTKIVTWYREGLRHAVRVHPRGGQPTDARFTQTRGPLAIDLGGLTERDVERLEVFWPSSALHEATLIDTPGIASLSPDVTERAAAVLTSDEAPAEADAVVYLMRHAHASDVRFLESFHDDAPGRMSPVNAVGVLSRADEVDGAALGSLDSAQRIAARYRRDPNLRRLCQTVVPVSALLAQTGATLREDEFRSLARITALPVEESEDLLRSSDRFLRVEDAVEVETRAALIARFGLFGLRLAVALFRSGVVSNASDLARELTARSGLEQLRELLMSRFAARAGTLRAWSALRGVEIVLRRAGIGDEQLTGAIERVRAGAHEFVELDVVTAIRTGAIDLPEDHAREAERLLGAEGADSRSRAGLPGEASEEDVRDILARHITTWRLRAEGAVASVATRDVARVIIRSCEGALTDRALRPAP